MYKLMQENFDHVSATLIESTDTKPAEWFVEGICIQTNILNKNGRIYPKEVIRPSLQEYIDTHMNLENGQSRAIGELNHPDSTSVNPKEVSHVFTHVQESGNDYRCKAKILDTANGNIVKELLKNNVMLGLSTRGLGVVEENSRRENIVTEYSFVTLGDIVVDPSAPDAFVNGLYEHAEWIHDNGSWKRMDISQQMESYKQNIDNSSRQDRKQIMIEQFKDYIELVLGKKYIK